MPHLKWTHTHTDKKRQWTWHRYICIYTICLYVYVYLYICLYVYVYIKGNWGLSSIPVFMFMQFDQISRSFKATKLCIQRIWRHTHECIKHVIPGFLCIFCFFHGENTSYNKVLECFWPFFSNLWSSKVWNDWTVSLWSYVIHANEETKYVNCGLHVNFGIFCKC